MDGKSTCLSHKIPARWVLCSMAFLGAMNIYFLRVNLSSAIVGMVYHGGQNETLHNYSSLNGSALTMKGSEHNMDFKWNANTQGVVLSSFFYGYSISMIPFAFIGRKYGRIRVVGICMLLASILTLLSPVILRRSFVGFIVFRILIGFLTGCFFTSMKGLWGIWAPVTERGILVGIQQSGCPFALLLVYYIGGYLTQVCGWTTVFYVTGVSSAVWSVIWMLFIYDTPDEHPRISLEEKSIIESSLASERQATVEGNSGSLATLFSSFSVWMTSFVFFFADVSDVFVYIMLSTYLAESYDLDVATTDGITSIIFVIQLVANPVLGLVLDFIISRGVRAVIAQNMFISIGSIIGAASYLALSLLDFTVYGALGLFMSSCVGRRIVLTGYVNALIAIAPEFSGITFSVGNTFGNIAGIFTPVIAGLLVNIYNYDKKKGWKIMFGIASLSFIIAGLLFCFFGRRAMKWRNNQKNKTNDCENRKLLE